MGGATGEPNPCRPDLPRPGPNETGPNETDPNETDLREQLRQARAAADAARYDSARLVRLLTTLGSPGTAEQVVDATLAALAADLEADVACLARVVGGRLLVSAAHGLPPTDPVFTTGWRPSPGAARAVAEAEPCTADLGPDADTATGPDADTATGPDGEAEAVCRLGLRSAVWLPLPEDGRVDHLLILYLAGPVPSEGDVARVRSVGARLQTSLRVRRREVALGLLTRSGHVLISHRERDPLLAASAELLRGLVQADRTAAFHVEHGRASCRARAGAPGRPGTPGTPGTPGEATPWRDGDVPAESLPGWTAVLDGSPRLLRAPDPDHPLLVVPGGPVGAPSALLYARWKDLPPLMAPVTASAALLASNLTAALSSADLYRALTASEASLRLITDSIDDPVTVVDARHRLVFASAAFERTLRHPVDGAVGVPLPDLVDPQDRALIEDALRRSIDTSTPVTVEHRFRTGDGRSVWVESVLRPAALPERSVVLSTRVIEERRRREAVLRHQAVHDPLTGLVNRTGVLTSLEESLAADRPGDVAVLYCDLDRFKPVNDRLGHAVGDALLRQVAERLRRCLRAGDLVARLGGDEFVFVLDGIAGPEEVAEVARRVTAAVESPYQAAGERVTISISVGAAVGARGRAAATALLGSADAAMYEAKRQGAAPHSDRVVRVVS